MLARFDLGSRGHRLYQRDDVLANGMVLDLPKRRHEPEAILELRHFELLGHRNLETDIAGRGKEIGNRYIQYLGDFVEPAAAHAVCTFFVFLHLLKRDAEFFSKVGLRK